VFQRSLLSELGGRTKALVLPGEVNCNRDLVSGPTTIKPDWAEGCCKGGSEVIGLRLGWCRGENARLVKTSVQTTLQLQGSEDISNLQPKVTDRNLGGNDFCI
jgi:hypothetical protein